MNVSRCSKWCGPFDFDVDRRRAFTLIELVIVIGILLLLAVITVSTINLSVNGDRVRAGARQVQSYLAGARDRAIYAKAPRGVRFLLDPTNNRTVSSLVFIQQTPSYTSGVVQLERLDLNNDNDADDYPGVQNPQAFILRGFDNNTSNTFMEPTNWVDLYQQGLLASGARVRIPAGSGLWYTVTTELLAYANSSYPPRLHLTTAYTGPTSAATGNQVPVSGYVTYELELPPSVLPNADPVQLPKGVVVHLDRCTSFQNLEVPANRGDRLPSFWMRSPSVVQGLTGASDPSGFDYTSQLDIMFSPRGVVTGFAAHRGIVHLYVGEQKDADHDRLVSWASGVASAPEYDAASDGYQRGDKFSVSIFTRTGAISVHPIYPNGDSFRYAETGEVAGK